MSEIKIVAELEIDPKFKDGLMPVLKDLVEKSRAETANLGYDLAEDMETPGHFFVIERWASAEGIEAHGETAHFKAFVASLDGKNAKLTISKLKPVF